MEQRGYRFFNAAAYSVVLFSVSLCFPPSALEAQSITSLRINEILSSNQKTPPPDGEGNFTDMVEIYNPTDGPTPLSLKDVILTDHVSKDAEGKFHPVNGWKIPAGSILPKGFVLIYCDQKGGLENGEAHAGFNLNADGELVAMFTPSGELIDMVVFPRLAEGTSYQRYPDGADTFCQTTTPSFNRRSILVGGSTAAKNLACTNIPPEINLHSLDSITVASDANPSPNEPVSLIVTTWDEKEEGVRAANMTYKIDENSAVTVPLVWETFLTRVDPLEHDLDPNAPAKEDKTRSRWKAEIPGQPGGVKVFFTFSVEDSEGGNSTDPAVICAGAQTQDCKPPFQYQVDYNYQGPLVLNEVAPLNVNIIQDVTDHKYEDYLEIFSATELSLEGVSLSGNPFRPGEWVFPPGSRISAGEHLIVWCDDDGRDTNPFDGEYHASFNLAHEGEGIFIFDTRAAGYGLIDGMKYGLTEADVTWSRIPDGDRTAPFKPVKLGSPREPNGSGERTFIRGDSDLNGEVELTDAVIILDSMFLGGPPLACQDAADADDSGELDLTDPITILNYLFQGGPHPSDPFPAAGSDPTTADPLGC